MDVLTLKSGVEIPLTTYVKPVIKSGTYSIFSARKTPEKPRPRKLVKWHNASISATRKNFEDIKRFIDISLQDIPRHIQRRLLDIYAKQYASETAKDPHRAANIGLRKAAEPLREILATIPFVNRKALTRNHILEQEADLCANQCLRQAEIMSGKNLSYDERIMFALIELSEFAKSRGVNPPFDAGKNAPIEVLESAILRMVCSDWWLRKFKRIRDQINEFIAIASGIIKKKHQEYCSNVCVANWRQQQKANRDYLHSMEIVNDETKEVFNLGEIAEKTTANPDLRRVELFVRVRGLEEIAADLGYEATFVTWTAPSEWHKNSDKWNGARPDETQQYLCSQWAKCRASIARSDIHWFGVRVAEPHADATPHWHMLIWYKKENAQKVKGAFREYALEHSPDEKGAQKNRIQFEDIDPSKGSATGYIAKYIAKNINAKNVENEPDYDGSGSLQDAANRVVAWASMWRIRQFQFFGAAQVSIWRECRRIKDKVTCKALEKVRSAADSGKWQAFTEMLNQNPVSIKYASEEVNKYNEPVTKIVGLVCAGFEQLTRTVKYRVCKAGEAAKASEAAKRNDSSATWSTVNNCTDFNDSVVSTCKRLGISSFLARPLAAGARIIDRGRGYRIVDGELREFAP